VRDRNVERGQQLDFLWVEIDAVRGDRPCADGLRAGERSDAGLAGRWQKLLAHGDERTFAAREPGSLGNAFGQVCHDR
jgi:hypothetical protein